MSDHQPVSPGRDQAYVALSSVLILVTIVTALVVYKSSAALRTLQKVAASGTLVARADLFHYAQGSTWSDVAARTTSYLAIIWPALVFGILVAGAVRTLVSPAWITRLFAGASTRQQLAATVAGAPLMLCSCCVAPVFSAVRERSGQLGPSLAVALAAPCLNPAALALTFMLFQPRIAFMRLALALTAVLLVSSGIARLFSAHAATPVSQPASSPCRSIAACVVEFLRSSAHIAILTVPILVLGIIAAMWAATHLQTSTLASVRPEMAIALAAIVSVPLAMPTFFEIPLALTLLSIGAPAGAAVAALFAGPAVNLASLLAIGRSAGWRVAAALAIAVVTLACLGGLLVGRFPG